jgi:hypothetical protein
MNWIAQTLWDLVAPRKVTPDSQPRALQDIRAPRPSPPRARRGFSRAVELKSPPAVKVAAIRAMSMQEKYDAIVEEMKQTYGIRVRKWRKSSSGVAWTIRYIQSGKIVKLIESPYPRGPMSCAIFLHEIGHHAIGLGVYRPRCLEEHHVWMWALNKMRERGFNVTQAVERRVERSMKYAVAKAMRRGLQNLPEELRQYL